MMYKVCIIKFTDKYNEYARKKQIKLLQFVKLLLVEKDTGRV